MKTLKKVLCAAMAVVQAASMITVGTTVSAAEAQKPGSNTIAAGENFSLVIKSDMSLWAAGDNKHGQLGLGSGVDNTDGMEVMKNVLIVDAEGETAFAIDAAGVLYGWGDNSEGQILPDQKAQYIYNPTKLMENVIDVSAGENHTVVLTSDGTAYGWGSNFDGELGFTANDKINSSVKLMSGIKDVAAGYGFTLLVTEDGKLYTSGVNSSGQLGSGNYRAQYAFNLCSVSDIVAAEAGDSHSLLLTEKGKVMAAGRNEDGQVGSGTSNRVNKFTALSFSGAAAIFADGNSSAAVTDAGKLYVWGNNDNGQLQNNSDKDVTAPKSIASGVISMAFGDYHSLLLKTSGEVTSAGAGMNGELFVSTGSAVLKPEKIKEDIKRYSAGTDHAAAIDSKGNLLTWGNNDCGQLGLGDLVSRNRPVKVALAEPAINVWCGNKVTFVQTEDLSVFAFGDNSEGMLGMETDEKSVTKPAYNVYLSEYEKLDDIQCGNGFAIALIGGDVYGWGRNTSGRLCDLGKTVTDPSYLTTEVYDAIEIAVGDNHVLALTASGEVYSWGGNGSDQLGGVEGIFTETPQRIEIKDGRGDYASAIAHISAAGNHSIAVDVNNTVWIWGANAYGQLGAKDYRIKVPSPIGYPAEKVEAGRYACAIIDTEGKLSLSGSNQSGALGDGKEEDRSKFSAVTASSVSSVSLGTNFGLYLRDDGALFGWGENSLGQVGTSGGGVSTKPVVAMKDALCEVLEQATAIKLSETELVIKPNIKEKLTAKITPSNADIKTVSWTSSNKKVASVAADGTVTAHAYGEAVITAKTSNGLTATCKVTVTIPVTSFSVSPSKSKILSIGQSFTITSKVYPSNAVDKTLTYKSSDTSVAKVNANGKVTAVSTGKAKITVTAKSNPEKTRTITIYVRPAKGKLTTRTATDNGVLLKWNKIEGADGYVIYRRTSPKGKTTAIADISADKARSYTDKNANDGKVYYYYIKAYYEVGSSRVYAPASSLYKVTSK